MVKQFSIDIELPEKDGLIVDVTEEEIDKILTLKGIKVLGVGWKATWHRTDSYMKGWGPDSSD